MSLFLDNAQKILDVARAGDSTENADFALLVRPDGGLHLIMESPLSLDAASVYTGASTAYRVVKSQNGIRVTGRSHDQNCVLEATLPNRAVPFGLLRDQPLYRMTSPLLTSATS